MSPLSKYSIECSTTLNFTVAGSDMVEVEDQSIQTKIVKTEDQPVPIGMVNQQGVYASLCLKIMKQVNNPFVGSEKLFPLDFHWGSGALIHISWFHWGSGALIHNSISITAN